jgi:glycosyltransferase involved in cell wall biosynthesis
MIRTKGLFEMVEVANRMPHISFLMAGMPNLENLNLEPPKNMKFLGNIDFTMLKGVLDSSDLFMFPTYSEGFSLALLEAMARGLPIVTTNVGANSDMIEKSGGLLVPTSDVEALCHALLQLENPELRSSMSIWNIAKVKNNYTAHQIIKKIRDLYASQREKSSKLNLLGSQE